MMSHLWIRNVHSGWVLVTAVPGVLDHMDLGVVGLNISHVFSSGWPPQALTRWEHLLWRGEVWGWVSWVTNVQHRALIVAFTVWWVIPDCVLATTRPCLWGNLRLHADSQRTQVLSKHPSSDTAQLASDQRQFYCGPRSRTMCRPSPDSAPYLYEWFKLRLMEAPPASCCCFSWQTCLCAHMGAHISGWWCPVIWPFPSRMSYLVKRFIF